MPLALWLVLRAVEPHRLFSRLYLAIVLALIYFPTELIAGAGLWLIWMALIVDPRAQRDRPPSPRCCSAQGSPSLMQRWRS